jgi:5-hydroxyisourate hydrolase
VTSVSTHVLDTAAGRPARGVPVTLEHLGGDGTWRPLASRRTDVDGRVADLCADAPAGELRLIFTANTPFFPTVTVHFMVDEDGGHYHVPLLLSPFGYSTYRGS